MNKELSNEEKILLVYEKLCYDYVYDDNLISYIQKVDDDIFSLIAKLYSLEVSPTK